MESLPTAWKLKKADWKQFQKAMENFPLEPKASMEQEYKQLENALLSATRASVPVTTRKSCKAWWTKNCAAAHRKLVQARREAKKDGSHSVKVAELTRARDALDKIIRQIKKDSWRDFASTLSPRVPSSREWNTIRGLY